MLFESKRLNRLETRLDRLEDRFSLIEQQWDQEKIAIAELQETASHMLSRIVMRNKRAIKAEASEQATEPSPPPPAVDETTLRILQRRGANAIPQNGG